MTGDRISYQFDTKHLQNHNTSHLVQLFGFGWWIIGYLGQLILWALTSLYSIIPNYGVICILFAFIIRLFTGPLTKQSFLSNQKMQTLSTLTRQTTLRASNFQRMI